METRCRGASEAAGQPRRDKLIASFCQYRSIFCAYDFVALSNKGSKLHIRTDQCTRLVVGFTFQVYNNFV